ncbi:MAG: ArsR/SmtB family transcription factor [Haloglomus sp.]
MDSAALLDLLGNENRRRILRLLSRKPCYVTEISEYLGVSPKAVIDHLRKLEEAGLVESRVDSQRRKYFSIARNLRLEVSVSPYGFGTKSAYPASRGFDMSRCRYLSLDIGGDPDGGADPESASAPGDADLAALAGELGRLEALENELSMAQRWVQGRLTDVMDDLSERFEELGGMDGRFYAEVTAAVADGATSSEHIARQIDASPEAVEDALRLLDEHGVVEHTADGWQVTEE